MSTWEEHPQLICWLKKRHVKYLVTLPSTGLVWKWPVAELWIGRWFWTHLKQTMCWTFNMYIYIYTHTHPGGSVTGVRKWSNLLLPPSEEPVFAFKTYRKKGPSTLVMTTLPTLQPQKGQPQLFLTLNIIERSIKFMWKCQWRSSA